MKEILHWFPGIQFPASLAEGALLPESKIDLPNRTMELVVDCSQPVDFAVIKTLELQISNLLNLNAMKLTIRAPKAEEPSDDPAWDAYLDEADSFLPNPVPEPIPVQDIPIHEENSEILFNKFKCSFHISPVPQPSSIILIPSSIL